MKCHLATSQRDQNYGSNLSDGRGAGDTDADYASDPWPSLLRPENWTREVTTPVGCPQTAGVTDEKSQLWSEAGGGLAPSSAFDQLVLGQNIRFFIYS